jgi:hypothetical protein
MTRTDIVGGAGPDFSAVVTGNITEAEGSFDTITGVTSECAVQCPKGTCPTSPTCTSANPANAYSLQLNTNYFKTSTCIGSPNPGCLGWEQFPDHFARGANSHCVDHVVRSDERFNCGDGWRHNLHGARRQLFPRSGHQVDGRRVQCLWRWQRRPGGLQPWVDSCRPHQGEQRNLGRPCRSEAKLHGRVEQPHLGRPQLCFRRVVASDRAHGEQRRRSDGSAVYARAGMQRID